MLKTLAARQFAEEEAARLDIPRIAPLILLGHPRGVKKCVLAAALSRRPVACMAMIEPADKTIYKPTATLAIVRAGLRVPTCVLGGGVGVGACVPRSSNFEAFYDALAQSGTARLLGVLPDAGHLQFVNLRSRLFGSELVARSGPELDSTVLQVTHAATAAWCAVCVPGLTARLRARWARGEPIGRGRCSPLNLEPTGAFVRGATRTR
jgi:hypothetical protein